MHSVPADRLPSGLLVAEHIVGRDDLLADLETRVGSGSTGGPPLLLLADAGMGKSRLLEYAVERARAEGLWVLEGRAVDGEATEGYRSLKEAIGRFDIESGCQPGDQLWVTWQSALRALTLTPDSAVGLAEELIRFLRAASRRVSILLVLDDLQWSDPDELAALGYLVDNQAAHGARLLLSSRTADLAPALERLLDRRVIVARNVPPLSAEAVTAMVRDCLRVDAVDPALLDFVRSRAAGSPFAVEELLAGLMRSGVLVREPTTNADTAGRWVVDGPRLRTVAPPTVAASVHRRLAALSPDARAIVQAAAVLGHEFDWRFLGAMTSLDERAVAAGLRAAADAGLIIDDNHGGGLRFRHALTRDEVVRGLLAPERRALARVALDLLRDSPDGSAAHGDLALALAEDAGDIGTWREVLLHIGLAAADRGALGSAVRSLRPLLPLPAAAVALAEVQGRRGDHRGVREAAEPILGSLPDDDVSVHRIRVALVRAAIAAGDLDQAEADLRHLPERPGTRDPARDVLAALIRLGQGDLTGAMTLAAPVAEDATLAPDLRCEALDILGRAGRTFDVALGAKWFEQALAVAESAGDPHARARALHELGTIDLFDNLRVDRLEAARTLALEIGDPHTIAHADFHLAEAYAARSETLPARRSADRAIDLAARIGSPVLGWAWLTTARTYAHERDEPAMEAAIARARATAGSEAPAIEAGIAGRVRAIRALFGADRAAALAHLDTAADLLAGLPGHHFPHWGLWALLRSTEASLTTADEERVRGAAGADTRSNRALLAAAVAVRAGRDGDRDTATTGFAEAETTLRGYESIDWLVHLSRWTALPRARADGWGSPETWAQDAVRWFSEHHHDPLATDCRRMLKQLGAPVPRRGRGISQVPQRLLELGVTSREVDVLLLIAMRLPNADIADRLVLSPRTVERHVSSLLTKTGLADRRELALFAERLGLA
ncbi:ATP-binding protein [Gordonia rhizosphera NBRC 16068]|uniref:ATP-binding protein n=1 Tax=Gordonia rhizosphera TaxID=83341 RepID=UPI003EE2EE30